MIAYRSALIPRRLSCPKRFPVKGLIFFLISFRTNCVAYAEFPDGLKHADVTPAHKKNKACGKTNYRPVSILTNISEIYEKWLYNQLSKYFDNLLVTTQCGFRKGFSLQYCLLVILEKFKKTINRGNQFGESFWWHWSQTSNCKILWMRCFFVCSKCNFFLPET